MTIVLFILKWVLLIGSIPLWFGIIRDMIRGKFGVDLIAGVALLATFIFHQYLAGFIVLVMLTGGQLLEAYAFRRARKDLSKLLSRAPHTAHIKQNDHIKDVPVDDVLVDMIVIIKPGEVVPVDGIIISGKTFLDESTLTGESLPVEKGIGQLVFSGTVNQNAVLEVRVIKSASESKYKQIVALVEEAEKSRAPIVRLADKYSVIFTIATFLIATLAWFLTHDIVRVLAILVVATPCPLILATPIAIISGMSKAAGRGMIVKNGGSLELMASAKTFIFDKTGTLTFGVPDVEQVFAFYGSNDDILNISASVDQMSVHVFAASIISEAKKQNLEITIPEHFIEDFGEGVSGFVNNIQYFLGKPSFIKNKIGQISKEVEDAYTSIKEEGKSVIYLADKEKVLGYIVFSDKIRGNSRELFDGLKIDHINRVVMITGDKEHVASRIADELGIAEYRAEYLPEDKLNFIKNLATNDKPVVMVGDGINDAPSLAIADVGIALSTHGKTATSDSADVVLFTTSITRVRELLHIARHTISVATQGIWFGIGMSIFFMIVAGFGYLLPVYGALVQEGIDILVIINALRVSQKKFTQL